MKGEGRGEERGFLAYEAVSVVSRPKGANHLDHGVPKIQLS